MASIVEAIELLMVEGSAAIAVDVMVVGTVAIVAVSFMNYSSQVMSFVHLRLSHFDTPSIATAASADMHLPQRLHH